MKSAVAILTYNRVDALKEVLSGLTTHCSQYPVAIFEDCGQRDGTHAFLAPNLKPIKFRNDLLADQMDARHLGPNVEVFAGDVNLGVAGNSNRALKWFEESGCDHLCLLNDDLHVEGDFVNFYGKAHEDLEIGFFSFCDFDKPSPAIGNNNPESYRWMTVNWRGYKVKLCPRMTGIMISITRKVLDTVGYFDARFGKFGQEHCDWTNRARMAGFMSINGQMQPQIDLEMDPVLLRHQDVATSVTGTERATADHESASVLSQIASRYGQEPLYRPFRLRVPRMAGGQQGVGIPTENLGHYTLIDSPA